MVKIDFPTKGTEVATDVVRVLLAEDDEDVRLTTRLVLEKHGYQVTPTGDGQQAWEAYLAAKHHEPFDVGVFDVAMPHLDGISLVKQIRAESNLPIILLTARDLAIDQVTGLEAGADDYVVKPFNSEILNARIRAVLRRNVPDALEAELGNAKQCLVRIGPVTIDTSGMTVNKAGQEHTLTVTELNLLKALLDHRGQVLDRTQLLEAAWGGSEGFEPRVVDVTIQRLRTKIGNDTIVTVRGAGYKLPAP